MSVAGVSSISPLKDQDHASQQQQSAFHSTGQKLQSLQLEAAKQSANGLDTVKLSGVGQGEKLASDVSTMSRHLQTGDLSAAQNAYQAIRVDLQEQQAQASKSAAKAQGGRAATNASSGGAPAAQGANKVDLTA